MPAWFEGGRAGAISKTTTAGAARSKPRIFASKVVCGDTACLQQLCDIGIDELPHMLAIFMQQVCSATVIGAFVRQTASGCANKASTAQTATTLDEIFKCLLSTHSTVPERWLEYVASLITQPGWNCDLNHLIWWACSPTKSS